MCVRERERVVHEKENREERERERELCIALR